MAKPVKLTDAQTETITSRQNIIRERALTYLLDASYQAVRRVFGSSRGAIMHQRNLMFCKFVMMNEGRPLLDDMIWNTINDDHANYPPLVFYTRHSAVPWRTARIDVNLATVASTTGADGWTPTTTDGSGSLSPINGEDAVYEWLGLAT